MQNSNGTVSIDFSLSGTSGIGITGGTMIDESDREPLNEYSNMLNKVNNLVDDGTLYIADDGNYYLVENDASSRNLTGGKNDFWVRSQKVWFIWIPVGYHIELSATNAIIFGAVSALFGHAGSMIGGDFDSFMDFMREEGKITGVDIFLEAGDSMIGGLLTILNTIWSKYSLYEDIKLVFSALMGTGGAIGAILGIIIDFILSLVWGNVGMPFLINGLRCVVSNYNTCVVEPNLILTGSSSYIY